MRQSPGSWLFPTESGLYCAPGGFHIDPHRPVDRAVITHGHSDHARAGHGHVLATAETIAVMKLRLGSDCAGSFQSSAYGEPISIGDVAIRLLPAGHIFGSAQVALNLGGHTIVVSGDYKRNSDPTCAPFELARCHVFVTEATFGLPVFRHEPPADEVARLIASILDQPQRTHLLGVYALGKCQRMIMMLRAAGYDRPIYHHGALAAMTELYVSHGFAFGELRPATTAATAAMRGELVICPPSAFTDRWSQRFDDPVRALASGWMRVRGKVRQRNVELPLVISDHADWPELLDTIVATTAEEIWVTHGREDALVHQLATMGIAARALSLVGFEDEAE